MKKAFGLGTSRQIYYESHIFNEEKFFNIFGNKDNLPLMFHVKMYQKTKVLIVPKSFRNKKQH